MLKRPSVLLSISFVYGWGGSQRKEVIHPKTHSRPTAVPGQSPGIPTSSTGFSPWHCGSPKHALPFLHAFHCLKNTHLKTWATDPMWLQSGSLQRSEKPKPFTSVHPPTESWGRQGWGWTGDEGGRKQPRRDLAPNREVWQLIHKGHVTVRKVTRRCWWVSTCFPALFPAPSPDSPLPSTWGPPKPHPKLTIPRTPFPVPTCGSWLGYLLALIDILLLFAYYKPPCAWSPMSNATFLYKVYQTTTFSLLLLILSHLEPSGWTIWLSFPVCIIIIYIIIYILIYIIIFFL